MIFCAGTPGEIALRELLDNAREIANQSGDALGQKILTQCNDIGRMADKLNQLRKQYVRNKTFVLTIPEDCFVSNVNLDPREILLRPKD